MHTQLPLWTSLCCFQCLITHNIGMQLQNKWLLITYLVVTGSPVGAMWITKLSCFFFFQLMWRCLFQRNPASGDFLSKDSSSVALSSSKWQKRHHLAWTERHPGQHFLFLQNLWTLSEAKHALGELRSDLLSYQHLWTGIFLLQLLTKGCVPGRKLFISSYSNVDDRSETKSPEPTRMWKAWHGHTCSTPAPRSWERNPGSSLLVQPNPREELEAQWETRLRVVR